MSVSKRGEVYHYAFQINGRRFRGSTNETTLSRARQVEALEYAKAHRAGARARVGKAPTLREFAEQALTQMKMAVDAGNKPKNTYRHYMDGWKQLRDTILADMRVDSITRAITETVQFRGGPSSQRCAQKVLGYFLNRCEDLGIIAAAPRIKRARVYNRELRVSLETERALLKHMKPDVADIFQIMLDCGLRPEEVMRMRWEHVNWERSQYFNPFGKTRSSRRMVPISERMNAILFTRKNNGSAWVFPQKNTISPEVVARAKDMFTLKKSARAVAIALGISWPLAKRIKNGAYSSLCDKDLHRISVAKQWEEAREKAGVDPKLVLYCARHEFATSFLEQGGDLATLKKLMGHTSISTTEKYLHPEIKDAAEIMNHRNRKAQAFKTHTV